MTDFSGHFDDVATASFFVLNFQGMERSRE